MSTEQSKAPEAEDAAPVNPPIGDLPPGMDGVEPGGFPAPAERQHMSRPEAVAILMRLANSRSRTEDEVTALEMGARRMFCRHFQSQRYWARRRAAANGEAVEPLSPEEELADTVARQKEDA